MTRPSVLFVCLGNICRSPLAEAAMRHAANEAGLDLKIDSAGTANYHIGEPPDPRSIAEAARRGIDIAHYRGRQLQPEDFRRFDWIVAMDLPNIRDIERIRPADATARVVMLFDLVEGREGDEVADPWCGEAEGFSRTWTDVTAGAAALIERLRYPPRNICTPQSRSNR